MSSKSQDQTFRDYLAEINNLAFADVDTNLLTERICKAYEAEELSASHYDDLKSELADSVGLNNIQYRTHEDYIAIEIDANTKIAEQYGDKVYVGEIIGKREVYKEIPTLYATIHFHIPDTSTPQLIEGYLKCSTLLELATIARGLSMGKILVIDRGTLEILESRTW